MSWSREIRPTPMAPILILLLGAFLPITEAGTIVGKPVTAMVVAALAFKLFLTKLRLFIFFILMISLFF